MTPNEAVDVVAEFLRNDQWSSDREAALRTVLSLAKRNLGATYIAHTRELIESIQYANCNTVAVCEACAIIQNVLVMILDMLEHPTKVHEIYNQGE